GELVVEHDGIAEAARLADSSEAAPDGRDVLRSKDRRAVRLVEYLEALVDDLDVLRRADLAVGVGRRAAAVDAGEADPVEVERRRGHVRRELPGLAHGVRRVHVPRDRTRVRVRIALRAADERLRPDEPQRARAVVAVRPADLHLA